MNFLLRTLFAFTVGFAVLIPIVERDAWVHGMLRAQLQPLFARVFGAHVSFGIKRIDLLAGTIEFETFTVRSGSDERWFWKVPNYRIEIGWWPLIARRTLDLSMEFDGMHVYSTVIDNRLAIQEHIEKLLFEPLTMPVVLHSLILKGMQLEVDDPEHERRLELKGRTVVKLIDGNMKTTLVITDGSVEQHNLASVSSLSASMTAQSEAGKQDLTIAGSALFTLKNAQGKVISCIAQGNWHDNRATLTIVSDDRALVIDPITLEKNGGVLAAHAHVDAQLALIGQLLSVPMVLVGQAQMDVRGQLNDIFNTFTADLALRNLGCPTMGLSGSLEAHAQARKGQLDGSGTLTIDQLGTCEVSAQLDRQGTGTLELVNTTPLSALQAPAWSIGARQLSLSLGFKDSFVSHGSYECHLNHQGTAQAIDVAGEVSSYSDKLATSGTYNKTAFNALYDTQSRQLETVMIKQDDQVVAQGTQYQPQELMGTLALEALRSIVKELSGVDLDAQGTIDVITRWRNGMIEIDLAMRDGAIRIPHTYNFINRITAQAAVDAATRTVVLTNITIALPKGSVRCARACVQCDDQWRWCYALAPLIVNNAVITLDKGIFAAVSGMLTLEKPVDAPPTVRGTLVINRSQLNENILSCEAIGRLFKSTSHLLPINPATMNVSLDILTKDPIRIMTPLLNVQAKLSLEVRGAVQDPELSGTISLLSGNITFPYKPLIISRGRISFDGRNLDNPSIELIAKNTIKKHTVNLHVSGTLKDHQVALYANPALREEQIIALLFTGSVHDSLNAVLPALLVQNLAHLILQTNQTPLHLEHYIKYMARPFNRIHLVPSFSDQTGRGGLRAGVEIEVTDRLRALIQKNFSLTEDTRFELEYQLSDDISVRAIRDERRDASAEVEVRWKF